MSTTPAQPAPSPESAAAVIQQLKTLFPALFTGGAKPLKLRIQADIQERAPGQFTKQQLSAALRRLTGSTAYLIALSKASHRFDLDGQQAGELADEHKQAAITELARRRQLQQERQEQEQAQRRQRAGLMRDYQRTTLTRANFCALKGIAETDLDALLAQAAQEAEEDRLNPRAAPNGMRPHRDPSSRREADKRPAGDKGRRGKPAAG
jgi:sRNA-binding protein